MGTLYVKSGSGATERANSTVYALGDRMVIAPADLSTNYTYARKWVWECTVAGTSGAAVPTWPSAVTQDVTTIADGSVVWTARRPGFSSGTTANWAFATIHLEYAARASAGGDTVYVSSSHSENSSAALNLTFTSTITTVTRVICVNDSVAPPTARATGAFVSTLNTAVWGIQGNFYVYGITFSCYTGGGRLCEAIGDISLFEFCRFESGSTGTGALWSLAGSQSERMTIRNSVFKFADAAGYASIWHGSLYLENCSIDPAGVQPTSKVFQLTGGSSRVTKFSVSNCDFSSISSGCALVLLNIIAYPTQIVFENVKLPASWTGLLNSSTGNSGSLIELYNCDGADTNYRYWSDSYFGEVRDETGIYKDLGGGGSSGLFNGLTELPGLSLRMVSDSTSKFPTNLVKTPAFRRWNDVVGSAITVTVDLAHDAQGSGVGGTLRDDDCWMELRYLGTSGTTLGTFVSNRMDDVVFGTPADLPTSGATWTGAGAYIKQKLSLSITPQERGYLSAVVCFAKASKTIYVDTELQVA